MFSKIVLTAAVFAAATSAFAYDRAIDKTVRLQDGSAVHIFKDGKMAMEDQFGRSISMNEGQTMQAPSGQSITMVGNETARLDSIRQMMLGGR